MKKLLIKKNWWIPKVRNDGCKPDQNAKGTTEPTTSKKQKYIPLDTGTQKNLYDRPCAVMFIERTREGRLVKALRQREDEWTMLLGRRIKYVERSGEQLRNILVQKDPWKGSDCGRVDCHVCVWGGGSR